MLLENIKRKIISLFWQHFNQTLSKYIPAENKIRKNKNSEDLLLNTKHVFSGQNLENVSGEYGKICVHKTNSIKLQIPEVIAFRLKGKTRLSEYSDSVTYWSSCLQIFFKIGALKNFTIFTEKHLCQSLFLIKLQVSRPTILSKRDSYTGVSPWISQNI